MAGRRIALQPEEAAELPAGSSVARDAGFLRARPENARLQRRLRAGTVCRCATDGVRRLSC